MNLPNKITLSRIVLVVCMIITLLALNIVAIVSPNTLIPSDLMLGETNINLIFMIVCIVFIFTAATDWLDGFLARKLNMISDLGKFLDPIADKLLVNSMIVFLCVPVSYTSNQMLFPVFCAIILIGRDILVDTIRMMAAKKNIVIAANIFGKLKTVFQMIVIPLVLLNGWPFSLFDASWPTYFSITHILIYCTTLISLLSAVIYIYQNRKVFMSDE